MIQLSQVEMEAIGRVFRSPEGREVKDWLTRRFVNSISFDEDPYKTAFNEGMRQLALAIVAGATTMVVDDEIPPDLDSNDHTTG